MVSAERKMRKIWASETLIWILLMKIKHGLSALTPDPSPTVVGEGLLVWWFPLACWAGEWARG